MAFDDHHPYSVQDMDALRAIAQNKQARLITTEKDYVRIPGQYRPEVHPFPVRLSFGGDWTADRLLDRLMQAAGPNAMPENHV